MKRGLRNEPNEQYEKKENNAVVVNDLSCRCRQPVVHDRQTFVGYTSKVVLVCASGHGQRTSKSLTSTLLTQTQCMSSRTLELEADAFRELTTHICKGKEGKDRIAVTGTSSSCLIFCRALDGVTGLLVTLLCQVATIFSSFFFSKCNGNQE